MYSYRENFKPTPIVYRHGIFYYLPRETLDCSALDSESCDFASGCHWVSTDNVCKSDSYSSPLLGSYTTSGVRSLTEPQLKTVNLPNNLLYLVNQEQYTDYLDTLNYAQLIGVYTALERTIPNFIHDDKNSEIIYNKMVEIKSQIEKNIVNIGGSAGGGGGTFNQNIGGGIRNTSSNYGTFGSGNQSGHTIIPQGYTNTPMSGGGITIGSSSEVVVPQPQIQQEQPQIEVVVPQPQIEQPQPQIEQPQPQITEGSVNTGTEVEVQSEGLSVLTIIAIALGILFLILVGGGIYLATKDNAGLFGKPNV